MLVEKAAGERLDPGEPDVELLGRGQEVVQGVVEHIVEDHDGQVDIAALDDLGELVGTVSADPDEPDLAGLLGPLQGLHGAVRADDRLPLGVLHQRMEAIDVDVVRLERLEAEIDVLGDPARIVCGFGDDDEFFAVALDRLAHPFLGLAVAVAAGEVDVVNAQLSGLADDVDGLVARGAEKGDRSQPDGSDFEAGAAESPVLERPADGGLAAGGGGGASVAEKAPLLSSAPAEISPAFFRKFRRPEEARAVPFSRFQPCFTSLPPIHTTPPNSLSNINPRARMR